MNLFIPSTLLFSHIREIGGRLLDELPAEAFDYVKRESVEERLAKTEASEGLRLSCSVCMALRTGKSS